MRPQIKIATCSYCERQQTLELTARQGHELACEACGAPLQEMKWLKAPEADWPEKPSRPRPAPHGFGTALPDWVGRKAKKKKGGRRNGMDDKETQGANGRFYLRAFFWTGGGLAFAILMLVFVVEIFSKEGEPFYEAMSIPGGILILGWLTLTPIFGILAWVHRGRKLRKPPPNML